MTACFKSGKLSKYRECELIFSRGSNLLLGPNGQGKTNLLEAIGLSASLRSFRKNGMDGLVRDGSDRSQLFFFNLPMIWERNSRFW